jgi:hypothetical protein
MLEDVPRAYSEKQYEQMFTQVSDKLILLFKDSLLSNTNTDQLKKEIANFLRNKWTGKKAEITPVSYEKPKLKAIKHKIANMLAEKLKGTISDNLLQINYKNMLIPLDIYINPDDTIVVSLQGIPLPNLNISGARALNYCLRLDFKPNNEYSSYKESVDINWVGSFATACPIPTGEGQGYFLLGLAEALAKAANIQEITLEDQSKIYCEKNKEMVDFRLLRIMQNKLPYMAQETANQEKWHSFTVSEIKNYIQKELNQLNPRAKNGAQIFLDEKHQSDQISPFMNYLWSQDCGKYSDVMALLHQMMGSGAFFDSRWKKQLHGT